MKLKVPALFLIAVLCLFPYRALEYSYIGGEATGIGGAGTTLKGAPESAIYNPAGIGYMTKDSLFYEIDAAILVNSLRWDYRFKFDAVSYLGLGVPIGNSKLKTSYTISTIFKGSSRDTKDFTVRNFSINAAVAPTQNFSVGLSTGYLLGHDKSDSLDTRNFAHGFIGSAGLLFTPLRKSWEKEKLIRPARTNREGRFFPAKYKTNHNTLKLNLGLSATVPTPIRWEDYGGADVVLEQLPPTFRLGSSLEIPFETEAKAPTIIRNQDGKIIDRMMKTVVRTNTLKLFLDLEYQGWSLAKFEEDGTEAYLEDVPFVFGKSFHPHFGVELYDAGIFGRTGTGGVYRIGYATRASVTPSGKITRRHNITLGLTVFAGDYFKISFAVVDTLIVEGILALAEKISGEDIRSESDTVEKIRFGLEMDLDLITQNIERTKRRKRR